MKTFKLYDAYIQGILILTFAIIALIKNNHTFLVAYYVVGTIQLISALVHFICNWKIINSPRYLYNYSILFLFIIACLGIFVPYFLFVMAYMLLFIAPILAICYTSICFYENSLLNKRPLALLK